jgi:hypothetical protein
VFGVLHGSGAYQHRPAAVADTLRFLGNGAVRRLRGGTVADEITGDRILWDNTSEVFRVEGGTASPTNPGGRVRAVLSPRAESPASAPAGPAASETPAARAAMDNRRPRAGRRDWTRTGMADFLFIDCRMRCARSRCTARTLRAA